MIEMEGVVKRFGATTALDGMDLTVPAGSVCGLLGPNGAGKTTAVRILATLLRPDAGRVRVGGHDVVRSPGRVRELIGLTGQFTAVDQALTGVENLLLVARLRGVPRARVGELLARFGLAEAGGRLVRTYSGGMRRRLDLAASLLGAPRLLVLDEPTTGLDPRARAEVWEMIRGLVTEGATVLLTTQYLEEADRLADTVSVIDHGRVLRSGAPAQLKALVGGQTLTVRPSSVTRVPETAAIVARAVGLSTAVVDGAVVDRAARDRARPGLVSGAGPGAGGSAADGGRDGVVALPLPAGADAPVVLAGVAGELGRAGIAIDEIGVRLASLDEVFLTLTGKEVAA